MEKFFSHGFEIHPIGPLVSVVWRVNEDHQRVKNFAGIDYPSITINRPQEFSVEVGHTTAIFFTAGDTPELKKELDEARLYIETLYRGAALALLTRPAEQEWKNYRARAKVP